MKMIFETKDMSNENKRFNKVLDLFFRMNPTERYWILLAFYFAKSRKLHVVDNYEGDDFVMATMLVDFIGHNTIAEEWKQKGVTTRSIVAFIDEDIKEIIGEIHSGFKNYFNSQFNNDWGVFSSQQTEPTILVEVAEILIGLSDDWYELNTSWAFSAIVRRVIGYGRSNEEVYQPEELTQLIVELLDVKEGSVYDPYARLCSFGASISSKCSYYAQALSLNYVIGKLNLLLHNKSNAVCVKEDSLNDWKGKYVFDYIVSIPPFGVRCNNRYGTISKDFLFRSAMDVSNKAIGVYSTSVLYDAASIRELVEHDLIETIILLPLNTFVHTGIETVIIVTNRNKKYKNAIRFVDASSYFETTGREIKLSVDSILSLCHSDGENSRLVDYSEIESNNYKLYPKLYFKKELEVPVGMKSISLREVLTPLRLQYHTTSKGRIFSFSQIDSVKTKGIIKASDLKLSPIEGSGYRVVNIDCLVIRRFGHFSAKYLQPNNEDVYMRNMFSTFTVKTDVVDPIYLLAELSKDYFLEQLAIYGLGVAGPKISTEEFLDLKILVPYIREHQIQMSFDSIERNLESFEKQKEVEYKNKMESFVRNQRQRKHAVAQVLNEILPSIENIENFILNHETVSKDSVVSRMFGTTLETYLTTIKKQLDKVAFMVDNFTSQEKYGEPEIICIEDFLHEYCSTKQNVSVPVVYEHLYEEEELELDEQEVKVKISKKDLVQMLDNLIANAVKYGVTKDVENKYGSTDEERKDFQIRIDAFPVYDGNKDLVVIKVSNNGEAVSKSISLEKLFIWGIGRGTGIGCWQVKEIAEHFGGRVSYEEFPDDSEGFVSEFKIVLPLEKD